MLRYGIRIVEKDEDPQVTFQERILSMDYDFAPPRKRYLEETLEA